MNGRVQITVRVRSVDSDGSIERIHGRVMRRGKQVRSGNLRSIGADSYRRTFLLPLRTGLYVLRVTATDDRGATRTKKRSKRVS
jgi:hypothetical protein